MKSIRVSQLLFTAVMAIAVGALFAKPAMANEAATTLATCLADNTTGKQRKALARWVFVGMSAHPEIRDMAKVTDESRETLDKEVAAMVTTLLTDNCLSETKKAMAEGGSKSLKSAFSVIGKLAFQELMTSPEVNSAFQQYIKYIDREKFRALNKSEDEETEATLTTAD